MIIGSERESDQGRQMKLGEFNFDVVEHFHQKPSEVEQKIEAGYTAFIRCIRGARK